MNKMKQFIAQQGSNNTVKIFEASTGQLYRVKKHVKTFSLPHGGLKSTIPL